MTSHTEKEGKHHETSEGIWYLEAVAEDGNGASAVVVGDKLYIATGVIFGWALSALGSGDTGVVAVKVHGT